MPCSKLQKKLRKDMLRCPVFLFKITHESGKDQNARLNLSNLLQRRVILRLLRQIAIGQIPMSNDTYVTLKAKKKKSLLTRFGDLQYFKQLIIGSKIVQIAAIKKFLSVLKILFKPIFYNGV